MIRIAKDAVEHATAVFKTPSGTAVDSAVAGKVSDAAKASSSSVKAPTNRTKKCMSDTYGNAFNRKFGMFAAINMMNFSIGGLIQAQGSMSSKLDEQQAGIDQSIGTTYGQGVQVSNSNAQLIESLLSSLQQTSSQIAQSQIQEVSFVKGAN